MLRVPEKANPEAKQTVRKKKSWLALQLPLGTQSGAVYRITEMELTRDGRKDEENCETYENERRKKEKIYETFEQEEALEALLKIILS